MKKSRIVIPRVHISPQRQMELFRTQSSNISCNSHFRKLDSKLIKKCETILLQKEIQPFLGNQIKGSEIQLSEPRFISFPPELLTLIQSIQCQTMPNYAQAAAAVRQKKERALLEKPGNQVSEKAGSQAKTRREKERQVETACKQHLDICHNGDCAES